MTFFDALQVYGIFAFVCFILSTLLEAKRKQYSDAAQGTKEHIGRNVGAIMLQEHALEEMVPSYYAKGPEQIKEEPEQQRLLASMEENRAKARKFDLAATLFWRSAFIPAPIIVLVSMILYAHSQGTLGKPEVLALTVVFTILACAMTAMLLMALDAIKSVLVDKLYWYI